MSFYPNEPSRQDFKDTRNLIDILKSHDVFDLPQNQQKQTEILADLEMIGLQWIYTEAINQGMTPSKASYIGGKLLTFGSYSLGVHQPGSDIDVILVAPNCIDIQMFFQRFLRILRQNPMVSSCLELPQASVPMIKLVMSDVEIDLLFISIRSEIVPTELDTYEARFLLYQDEWDQKVLNGPRTTDAILKYIPSDPSFHITLHLVKLWAKRK